MSKEITEKTIAMRNGTVKMKHDREYWSEEDLKTLYQRFSAGVPVNEIAIELERSESAVYQQIMQRGLYVRSPETTRGRRSAGKEPVCLCSVCSCDPALCPLQERCPKIREVG